MTDRHGSPREEGKGYAGRAPRLALTEYKAKKHQFVIEIDGLEDEQPVLVSIPVSWPLKHTLTKHPKAAIYAKENRYGAYVPHTSDYTIKVNGVVVDPDTPCRNYPSVFEEPPIISFHNLQSFDVVYEYDVTGVHYFGLYYSKNADMGAQPPIELIPTDITSSIHDALMDNMPDDLEANIYECELEIESVVVQKLIPGEQVEVLRENFRWGVTFDELGCDHTQQYRNLMKVIAMRTVTTVKNEQIRSRAIHHPPCK
eukprot:scaffold52647_cov22-Cyclotella_meneghiniana.AAC.1